MPEETDEALLGGVDYWSIARRRRWWLLLPTFLCWVVVWAGGWLWPDRYESEALILVERQKVPEQYVAPNVTVDVQDQVRRMTQQILSRTRLQATIDRFHLYPRSRGLRGLLESKDPVDQMRKDIQIELVQSDSKTGGRPGELTSFKIHYYAASPEIAQQVNSELTSLFIEENLKSQQQLSEGTTAFLSSQLADSRVKLEAQEAKVREFKAKHLGDLPSQMESNVQILSGLQSQLQNAQRAIDGATQQKLYLESLVQQYQSVQAALNMGDSTVSPPEAMEKELTEMRNSLTEARSRYTDDYPDIVALKEKIAQTETLKKQIEQEIASRQKTDKGVDSVASATPVATEGAQRGAPTSMMQIQSQLKANQLEIQNYEKRRRELESQISAYEGRLNLTPETEQELADISRGYEESKTSYNSLLQKQGQSQLATSLQQRQQGEQFSIIDPPNAPDKPSSPNHLLVSLGGLGFGIVVGFGLIAFLELTNVFVWHEKDLEGLVQARVLVDLPRLSSRGEDRIRVLGQWMEVAAAAAIVCLIVAGNLYAFYKG
jgi:polysaccharide chain length determinant protein (PEP-CTERM system associated)